MKKFVWLTVMIALTFNIGAAPPLLERFDTLPVQGKLLGGAELDPAGGLERGALKAHGNNTPVQYIYSYSMEVKPGEKYAFSFNYKTSEKASLMAVVAFDAPDGEKAPTPIYFKSPRSIVRWMHRQFDFTVPEGVTKVRVMLRLSQLPESEFVLVDHFRIAPITDGWAKGIDLTEFETTFDQWAFDRHLVFDHFMLGPGGTVVNEWREAKVGEAFYQASGNGAPMQYAMFIDNLTVTPGSNYVFEAWIKATAAFRFPGTGMLIFFYKDANGKALGQSRYHIRPTDGEWREMIHTFTAPPNCAMVDIGLNIRRQPESETVKLDHIRFRKGVDKAYLRHEIDPDKQEMSVLCAITGSIEPENIEKVEFEIKSDAGKVIKTFTGKPAEAQIISLKEFADGQYRIDCRTTLKDGKILDSGEQMFGVYKNPDWLNDIGLLKASDPAPHPWNDLTRENNSLSVWNGRFEFNDKMQLTAINGKDGSKYLAAPVTLSLDGQDIFGGSEVKWEPGKCRVSGQTTVKGKNWTGELVCTVDYVGMVRYTLTVKADADVTLDAAKLEIKVPDVDFIHRYDGSWTNIGAVDLNKTKTFTTKHFYNFLYGNVDRGICFYSSKLYPAQMDYENDWFTADKAGNLSAGLINAPLKLKAGEQHTFDFAVCPYPVRPNENNWQRLRFRAGTNNNFNLLWHSSKLLKYAGSLPEASNPRKMAEYISQKKGYLLVYQIPTYIINTLPQWSYFAKKWKAIPSRSYNMTKSHGGIEYKGDYRERSWTDLYVKSLAENMRDYNWDGVYYDCFGADTLKENGETFIPIFECRVFQERVYNAQRFYKKDSITMSHLGGGQASPLTAFSNIVLMGEQYRAAFLKHTYYLEFMTLDEFRYENAVNIGPDRMLLPQYRQDEKINSPAVATHFMGISLLHNQMVYPNFIRSDIELSIRDRQYAFGMDTSSFFGYWKPNQDGIGTNNPAVPASFYKNNTGFFITVLNTTAQEQEFSLKSAIPFSNAECFFPDSGKSTVIKSGEKIKLAPYMAAFITVKKP